MHLYLSKICISKCLVKRFERRAMGQNRSILYSITFVNYLLAKWYKSCVKNDNYDRRLANWPISS